MYQQKTLPTDASVEEFLKTVENEQQRSDSYHLIEIMKEITGCEARMWGGSIIGFGSYHYKYASGHQGNAAALGFSPRKNQTSIYIYSELSGAAPLLQKLGKFKMGKACIYVKKLSDIDENILKEIGKHTLNYLSENHQLNL
jgi:hypothetical protein